MTDDKLTIRSYLSSDKEKCLDAFQSNVPQFFTTTEIGEFSEWLDSLNEFVTVENRTDESYYYVAELNGKIVGGGGFGYDNSASEATLAWGFVAESHHRQGIGGKLLEFRLRQIKKLFPSAAVLLDTTQHSYRFFQKAGFAITKITKDSYSVGMDRYDMKLEQDSK